MGPEAGGSGVLGGRLGVVGLAVLGAAVASHAVVALGDKAAWPYLIVVVAVVVLVVRAESRFGRHRAMGLGASVILLGALGLIAVLAVRPALSGYFLAEDFGLVKLWHRKPFADFWSIKDISEAVWGEPLDEWRPLWAFTYRLDYLAFGRSAVGPHITNLAIHGLNAILVYWIVGAVTPGARPTALLGSLLFAVAPLHSEPISWITGRVDSLSTVFYLAAFLCFARSRSRRSWAWYCISLVSMALGLLCKETLLTLPFAIASYDLSFHEESVTSEPGASRGPLSRALVARAAVYLPFACVAGAYAAIRWATFGSGVRAERLHLGVVTRVLEDYRIGYLLTPFDGVSGWPGRTPGARGPFSAPLTAVVLGAVLALLFLLVQGRRRWPGAVSRVVYFGLVWHLITTLPLLVVYPSARHLYLPSAGFAIALAGLILPASPLSPPRLTVPRIAVAVVIILIYGATLSKYCEEWAAAGRVSRTVRAGIERLAAGVPPGSVVVLGALPGSSNYDPIRIWKWALPYALQPPASPGDIYARLRIVESPDVYCCPIGDWWARARPIVSSLVSGGDEDQVTLFAVQWHAETGGVSCTKATLRTGEMRHRLQGAVPGDRVELNPQTARRLLVLLVRAVDEAGEPCSATPGLAGL